MTPSRIIVARFSPTGRTRRLMSMLAQGLAGTGIPVEELDLTDRLDREEPRVFSRNDLVFLGVPVYFGRAPRPCSPWRSGRATAQPPCPSPPMAAARMKMRFAKWPACFAPPVSSSPPALPFPSNTANFRNLAEAAPVKRTGSLRATSPAGCSSPFKGERPT